MSMTDELERRWYLCVPEKNTECGKRICHIYGGECELTDKEECAELDPAGEPIDVDIWEALKMKMGLKNEDRAKFSVRMLREVQERQAIHK